MLLALAREYCTNQEHLLQMLFRGGSNDSRMLRDLFTFARIVQIPGFQCATFSYAERMTIERSRVMAMSNHVYGHLSGKPTFDFTFREFVVVYQKMKRDIGVAALDSLLTTSPTNRVGNEKNLAVQRLKTMSELSELSRRSLRYSPALSCSFQLKNWDTPRSRSPSLSMSV